MVTVISEHPLRKSIESFDRYLADGRENGPFPATDYHHTIRPAIEYYASLQNDDGAIIDPGFATEWHYSTPSFALAAALLASSGDGTYIEPAARALVWSARLLSEGRAPQNHADFFTIKLMHAHSLLEPLVDRATSQQWMAKLSAVDPYKHYYCTRKRRPPERIHNWNALSLAGEYWRYREGLAKDTSFVDEHVRYHLQRFTDEGFYRDGHDGSQDRANIAHPMAYDLVARCALGDLLAAGYAGEDAEVLEQQCTYGAISSLFFQDPNGEYPCLGRSSYHIWNEAYLAYTAEWAARRLKTDYPRLAGALRRAAQLALLSMESWRRPEGNFFAVKNRFLPEERHGFEQYSISTTYNLWALAALAMAATLADDTIEVSEIPSEGHTYAADSGPAFWRHVVASGGTYALYDSCPDESSDPIGISRFARKGFPALLGPGQGAVEQPRYSLMREGAFLAHAPGWTDRLGASHELPSIGLTRLQVPYIHHITPEVVTSTTDGGATMNAVWRGGFMGARFVESTITVGNDTVEVFHRVEGAVSEVFALVPLFLFDGEQYSEIEFGDREIRVSWKTQSANGTLVRDSITFTALTEAGFHDRDGVAGTRIGLLKRAELRPAADAKDRLRVGYKIEFSKE